MGEPAGTNWERFGRASKAEAPEISELNLWRRSPTSFDVASYYCQVMIHRAHTVMLAEEGIIGRDEAARSSKESGRSRRWPRSTPHWSAICPQRRR